jgi:hypothetical protein
MDFKAIGAFQTALVCRNAFFRESEVGKKFKIRNNCAIISPLYFPALVPAEVESGELMTTPTGGRVSEQFADGSSGRAAHLSSK